MLDEIKAVARRYSAGKITSAELSYGIAFILSTEALSDGEAKDLAALLTAPLVRAE